MASPADLGIDGPVLYGCTVITRRQFVHCPTVPHMSLAIAYEESRSSGLSPFETAFIRTVLEHRGVSHRPTLAEFTAAFDVLRRYDEQCRDNPRDMDAWEPRLGEEDQVALRAKVFLMFGATKPLPSQWHKAHAALYGPMLCETCG